MSKKQKMKCKEFLKLIPDFLDDNLEGRRAERFLEHFDECSECKEELHIQFLVKEGIARLEGTADFNLNGELARKIDNYRKSMKNKRVINTVIYCMEAVAVMAVIFILILVFGR